MLNVVIGSRTNVNLTLWPLVVPVQKGEESISELRLYADDAQGLASRVRDHLAARNPTPPSG